MKAVPVRELQREIRAILDRVEKGESLEITRRGRPVARLVPARPVRAEAWPDLDARARKVTGAATHHSFAEPTARCRSRRPMTVYFDSSALVAVYVTEAYSVRARRELRKLGRVPWTLLHDLEVITLAKAEGLRAVDIRAGT